MIVKPEIFLLISSVTGISLILSCISKESFRENLSSLLNLSHWKTRLGIASSFFWMLGGFSKEYEDISLVFGYESAIPSFDMEGFILNYFSALLAFWMFVWVASVKKRS